MASFALFHHHQRRHLHHQAQRPLAWAASSCLAGVCARASAELCLESLGKHGLRTFSWPAQVQFFVQPASLSRPLDPFASSARHLSLSLSLLLQHRRDRSGAIELGSLASPDASNCARARAQNSQNGPAGLGAHNGRAPQARFIFHHPARAGRPFAKALCWSAKWEPQTSVPDGSGASGGQGGRCRETLSIFQLSAARPGQSRRDSVRTVWRLNQGAAMTPRSRPMATKGRHQARRHQAAGLCGASTLLWPASEHGKAQTTTLAAAAASERRDELALRRRNPTFPKRTDWRGPR